MNKSSKATLIKQILNFGRPTKERPSVSYYSRGIISKDKSDDF
jgi:hypothetical protein